MAPSDLTYGHFKPDMPNVRSKSKIGVSNYRLAYQIIVASVAIVKKKPLKVLNLAVSRYFVILHYRTCKIWGAIQARARAPRAHCKTHKVHGTAFFAKAAAGQGKREAGGRCSLLRKRHRRMAPPQLRIWAARLLAHVLFLRT